MIIVPEIMLVIIGGVLLILGRAAVEGIKSNRLPVKIQAGLLAIILFPTGSWLIFEGVKSQWVSDPSVIVLILIIALPIVLIFAYVFLDVHRKQKEAVRNIKAGPQ